MCCYNKWYKKGYLVIIDGVLLYEGMCCYKKGCVGIIDDIRRNDIRRNGNRRCVLL